MASAASSTAPGVNQDVNKAVTHGVAPLRAGQGTSFVLRRLHSLSGIVPVGAFLFEHILISNSTAISGPPAYARQVSFLANLPLVFFLELFGIWLPIAFHALYGFYIWYRGDGNSMEYPWTGNWMYTAQRWTGGIAFAYIVWHTYTMRFTGVDLHDHPEFFVRQGAAEVHNPAPARLLRGWADLRVVAFRLRHLAVRREVGHCFRRQGAAAISQALPGIFPADERGRPGELVHIQRTFPDAPTAGGTIVQTSHAPQPETVTNGKPVE